MQETIKLSDQITIVVPCKNEENYIHYLLDSLRSQSIDNTSSGNKQSKRHSGTGNDRISYPPGLRASSVNYDQLAKI